MSTETTARISSTNTPKKRSSKARHALHITAQAKPNVSIVRPPLHVSVEGFSHSDNVKFRW